MGDTYSCMAISVSDTEKLFLLWYRGQFIVILSRTRIMKNTIFVDPRNEKNIQLKLLLNKINRQCGYMKELMKITNVKPSKNSEYSDSLNQSIFPSQICDISLPQDQTGSVYFSIPQKDTSYFHIGSKSV